MEKRGDLKNYNKENLAWLANGSLSKFIRLKLLEATKLIFSDRPFVNYLTEILSKRRYKRYLKELESVVCFCLEERRDIYERFFEVAKT